jgi:hypothetical protein
MAQLLLDRVQNFGGGTDGFRPANVIDPNQCQDMVNMIIRDNYECRTRPGADQIDSKPSSFVKMVTWNNPAALDPLTLVAIATTELLTWTHVPAATIPATISVVINTSANTVNFTATDSNGKITTFILPSNQSYTFYFPLTAVTFVDGGNNGSIAEPKGSAGTYTYNGTTLVLSGTTTIVTPAYWSIFVSLNSTAGVLLNQSIVLSGGGYKGCFLVTQIAGLGITATALLLPAVSPLPDDSPADTVYPIGSSVLIPSVVQGLTYYNSPGAVGINPFDGLVLAEGGYLYTWTTIWSAALTPAVALHDANVNVTMCQGLDKLLISDGVGALQIFCGDPTSTGGLFTTGFASCGTDPNTSPPAGATVLCWCAGRMFASGYDYPNDVIYGSNLLEFGAGQWNLTTQSFRIGDGDGQAVVSMLPFQEQIMAVLKDNSIWLLDCNSSGTIPTSPTVNWSAQEQGDRIGNGIGCCGKNAACNYLNDVLFMSNPTGVHSIQRMQAAAGQYELTEPLSMPIQPYIDRINWSYASGIVALKYKHYAMFFVPLDNSIYNNYALVWNGHLWNPGSGTFGQWTGVFTGWTPTAVCVSRINKLVQLVIGNHDGSVCYWKDSPAILASDSTYLDNGAAIPWSVTTRALTFQNPDNPKELSFWLLRFNSGNAVVSFNAYLDLANGDAWSSQLAPGGATLPTLLPFLLTSVNTKIYRSSLGLPFCDEVYYTISSPGGWAALRSITAGAFLQPIRDPKS